MFNYFPYIRNFYNYEGLFSGDYGASSMDLGSINKARRKIHRAKGYRTYGKRLRLQKKRNKTR